MTFEPFNPAAPEAEDIAWGAGLTLANPPEDFDTPMPDGRTSRQLVTETYRNYYEHRKAKGLPLFPTKTAAAAGGGAKEFRKAYSGLDSLQNNLAPEQWQTLEYGAEGEADPQEYHARAINSNFLSSVMGREVPPESLTLVRDAYAKDVLGITGPVTDKAVYNGIRERFTQDEADAATFSSKLTEGITARLSTVGKVETTLPSVDAKNDFVPGSTKPLETIFTTEDRETFLSGISERNRPQFRERWNEANRELSRQFRKHKPLVEQITRGVALTRQADNPEQALVYDVDRWARMLPSDPKEREIALAMLGNTLQNLPEDERGALVRIAAGISRGAKQAATGINQAVQAQARQFMQGDEGFTSDEETAFMQNRAVLLDTIRGNGMKLSKVTDNLFTQSYVAAAPSAWMFPAAFTPVGQLAIVESMAGQSVKEAAQNNPDVPEGLRTNAATASGMVQGAIETFTNTAGVKLMLGKLPRFAGLLNKVGIQSAAGRAALGFAAGYAATTGMEYAEEAAQGATDMAFQALAADLAGQNPDVDWGKYFAEWAGRKQDENGNWQWGLGPEQKETLLAVSAFGMIAGAGASFNHFKYGSALARSKTFLRAHGFTEAEVRDISNTSDLDEAAEKTRAAFLEAQERGKTATPEEKEKLAELRAEAIAVLKASNDAYAAAGMPRVEKERNEFTETDQWVFIDTTTGARKPFETEEEALGAWQDWNAEQSEENIASIQEAGEASFIDYLTSEGAITEDVNVERVNKTVTPATERAGAEADVKAAETDTRKAITPQQARAAREKLESAKGRLANITARVEVFLLERGVDPANATAVGRALESVTIKAKSFATMLQGRVVGYTVQLFNGAEIQDIAEDFSETAMKLAVEAGFADPEIILDDIRRYEAASGHRVIDAGYEYDPGNTLPLIEGFSKLARGVLMGEVRSGLLPPEVSRWIEMQASLVAGAVDIAKAAGKGEQFASDVLTAGQWRAAVAAKQVPPRLERLLKDSLGLDPEAINRRLQKRMEEQLAAEAMDGFPEISEVMKGRLPHPETLRENSHPLYGEVRRIWESLKKPTKRRTKDGKTVDRANEANAYFLPVGTMEDLDNVRQAVNERGFDFDSITDMLDALDVSISYGKPFYGTQSAGDESWAMGSNNADYLAAVKAGDMATAQRIVDDAAKAAGYDTSRKMFHGGTAVDVISPRAFFTHDRPVAFLSSSQDHAGVFAGELGQVHAVYYQPGNQLETDEFNNEYEALNGTPYDSVISKNIRDAGFEIDEVVITRPSQVKSADPITYDKLGNVIPLSQRFDSSKASISYAMSSDAGLLRPLITEGFDSETEVSRKGPFRTFAGDYTTATRRVYRFVKEDETGKIISALSVAMKGKRSKSGVIAAVYTDPEHRRQGHAASLLRYAQKSFDVKHSTDLTNDGRAFKKADGTSYAMSTPGLLRLEEAIAKRMTRGPDERAEYFQRLRDRLASTVLMLRETKRNIATDQTDTERERARIRDAVAEASAIIKALPMEARGRVPFNVNDILDADTERGQINGLIRLIDRADEALEVVLLKEYRESFETLLDLAKPDLRQNKQVRGRLTPETQRMVGKIMHAVTLTPAELAIAIPAKQAEIEALEATQPNSPEEIAAAQKQLIELYEEQVVLETFGAFSSLDAAATAHAYEQLQSIYITGRTTRKILDEARKAEIDAAKKELLATLPAVDQAKHATRTADKGFKDQAEVFRLGMSSFHQVMEWLFPRSTVARDFQEQVRKADRSFTRAKLAAKDRFDRFTYGTWNLSGVSRARKRNRILADLSTLRTDWGITLQEGITFATEKLTEEQAAAILDGTMKTGWETDNIAMTSLRQALADFRMQRIKAQNEDKKFSSKVIKFQRLTNRGQPGAFIASDLQALYFLQLFAQEQYRPALDKFGFTADVMESIERKINPKAKDLGDFLRDEYDAEWARLNPVYRAIYGLDMPRIRNYAPGMFEHLDAKSGGDSTIDPYGNASTVNAMSAGFTKARTHHMARPKLTNAMAGFWGHLEATEYFIAYAEIMRDARQIFRNPEVRRRIEGNFGTGVASLWSQWLDALEVDGNFRAVEMMAMASLTHRALATQSAVGLAFNIGVLFKQTSAAFGPLLEMPTGEAIKGIIRAIHNPGTLKTIWNSEAVQQRVMMGISPEDRKLIDAAKASPSLIMELLEIGRLPIAYADAAFTTLGASVAYNYHLQEALKAGMAPAMAEQSALAAASRVIERTAQPATAQDKSMAELTAKTFGKFLFLFKSDPRQKLAIVANAVAEAKAGRPGSKGKLGRKVLFGWILYGMMAEVMTDIWQSISRDDDDEERWAWNDYAAAAITGPIGGLPLIGGVFEYLVRSAIGTKAFVSNINPLDQGASRLVPSTMKLIDKLVSEDKDVSVSDILTAGQQWAASAALVAGAFSPQAAIAPAALRLTRDAWGALTNMAGLIMEPTEDDKALDIIREISATEKTTRDGRADERAKLAKDLAKLPAAERADRLARLDPDTRASVTSKLRAAQMTSSEMALSRLTKDNRKAAVDKITAGMGETDARAYRERLQSLGLD